MTGTLWKPHLELIERTVETQDVELAPAPDGTPGLVLEGRDGAPSWWLRPARDAEVAMRLLEDRDLLRDVQVDVAGVRDRREDAAPGTTEFAEAKLELRAGLRAEALGEVVELASLTAPAQRVLREPRRNAFAFAADPWLYLPSVMRECMERLSSPLLATAFAAPGEPLRIDSFVFVGPDGLPRYEPGMQVPAESSDPELPIDRRCELLGSVSLLVRTTRGGRQQILRLRPDRVWLWTSCESAAGVARHVSRWQWERAPAELHAAAGAPRLACRFLRTENRYRLTAWDGSAWLKVLVTPLAVAVDVAMWLPVAAVLVFLGDDDDEMYGPWQRH